jgi:hypothetical protein
MSYLPNVTLRCIRPLVDFKDRLSSKSTQNETIDSIAGKNKYCQLCLEQMLLCIDDPRVEVRICNHHATETVNVLVK